MGLADDTKTKQVIIVRTDVEMGKGKLATQVAHAAINAYRKTRQQHPRTVSRWVEEGEKKIVLRVDGLNELMELKAVADKEKIPNVLIRDAGLTQLEPGTITCLGIGPWDSEVLDRLFGHLRLL